MDNAEKNKTSLINETLDSFKVLPTSLRVIKTEKKKSLDRWTTSPVGMETGQYYNFFPQFLANRWILRQLSATHTLGTRATLLLQLTDVVFILSTKTQQNYIPGTFQEIPIPVYKNSCLRIQKLLILHNVLLRSFKVFLHFTQFLHYFYTFSMYQQRK